MAQDDMKQAAAKAAIEFIPLGSIIGIGTGSTANFFIEELATIKHKINGTVASSIESAKRLKEHGIEVLDLNTVNEISVYIDGTDEATRHLHLIKGGGGALTREKIVAAASNKFVCIADESKLVHRLGKFPLPVEIIPMARGLAAREIVKLGGEPVLREGFTTDNGNIILDIHNLDILDPVKMEQRLNHIAGLVSNGLFACRAADVLLLGTKNGVKVFQ